MWKKQLGVNPKQLVLRQSAVWPGMRLVAKSPNES